MLSFGLEWGNNHHDKGSTDHVLGRLSFQLQRYWWDELEINVYSVSRIAAVSPPFSLLLGEDSVTYTFSGTWWMGRCCGLSLIFANAGQALRCY